MDTYTFTLSLPALATKIAEFLTELDLRHVTVVCNDWGGAQLVISPGGTDRVANLVLVSCEAFDNYPPGLAGRPLCRTAALPGGTFLTAQLLRPRWIRHLPATSDGPGVSGVERVDMIRLFGEVGAPNCSRRVRRHTCPRKYHPERR